MYQHCVLKRIFINNEHTEVLAIGQNENGERTSPQLFPRPSVTINICPKALALMMDLRFPERVLLGAGSPDPGGVMLCPHQKA